LATGWAAVTSGGGQRRGKLGLAVKGIGPLPGFRLGERLDQFQRVVPLPPNQDSCKLQGRHHASKAG